MSDNDGDRELVLGNKQLLAIFFVGVLLCGVFFAVGYVVGGNSVKAGATVATDSAPASTTDGRREEPQTTADTLEAPAMPPPTDVGGEVPAAEPRMADNPAAAGSAPPVTATAALRPVTQPAASAPLAKLAATPSASSVTAPTSAGIFVSVPEKGASYVQVIATPRPHADDLVKSLREARLPAILAESSKPELFEVLVGPYRAPLALADAKRKLTDLGFDGLIVRKQ